MTSLHLIGDSISIDYHPALLDAIGETFTYSRLQGIEAARKDLDQPVFANGGSSTRVKTLVHDWMASGQLTDFLAVNCGLHDIKRDRATGDIQTPLALYRENLEAVVEEVRGRTQLIWITTTPVNERLHQARSPGFERREADLALYNQTALEVMAAEGIPVIDLFGFTRSLGKEEDLFRDHVHFHDWVSHRQAFFLQREFVRILNNLSAEAPLFQTPIQNTPEEQ